MTRLDFGFFYYLVLPCNFTKSLEISVQGFEKMISGMYLGDIVRRVILRILLETNMFGPVSYKLSMSFILRFVLYINDTPLC